jgi:hypothetical protein
MGPDVGSPDMLGISPLICTGKMGTSVPGKPENDRVWSRAVGQEHIIAVPCIERIVLQHLVGFDDLISAVQAG